MIAKVYKIGGSIIEDPVSLDRFCRDFAALEGPRVLVHGGGVMASGLQEALGLRPVRIEGRRVTDSEALKVVTMTYAGWCNKTLVAALQKYGCNSIGLAGCDASVIKASKRPPKLLSDGITLVDYGFVGDVTPESVDTSVLRSFMDMGLVPVLSAINHDGQGQLLNTNADTIASSVASALKGLLVCCFELEGVMADRSDSSSVLHVVNAADFERMKADGSVSEGMIPKIENALNALRAGACGAVIKSAARLSDNSGTRIEL